MKTSGYATMVHGRRCNPHRSIYDNFCKTGNDVIDDVIIWVQDGNCKKWLERIKFLVLVRSTI